MWPIVAARLAAQTVKPHPSESPSQEVADQICAAVQVDLKDYSAEGPVDGCEILQISLATGDGAKTVLVDLGAPGAYTDLLAVYRIEHGTVTAATFKDLKGRISKGGLFARGSSVMNSVDVRVSPTQHAIFTIEVDEIGEGSAEWCGARAYQWVSRLGMYVERASKKSDEVRCNP